MRFRLIEDHREIWPVRVMCKALSVSPSGYYAWRSRPDSPRQIADRVLLVDIRRVHAQHRERYGAPRIYAQLRAEGQTVSRKRVERVMRQHGIRARTPRRYRVCTTDSKQPRPLIKVKPDQIEELVAEIKRGDIAALETRLAEGYTLTDLLVSSLRHIVVARPGMTLAVGDFSMIEACVVLALAKQRDKVELIRNGKDPYRDMGAAIYKLAPEQREAFVSASKDGLSAEQELWRTAGKTGVLSCGFGISPEGLYRKYP